MAKKADEKNLRYENDGNLYLNENHINIQSRRGGRKREKKFFPAFTLLANGIFNLKVVL